MRTANYIISSLQDVGWSTESQQFEYRETTIVNLIARSGQGGGKPVLLGAHYDTRRRADRDPEYPELPVLGANDGASGTAVLIELARVLDLSRVNGEVWLVFFDAEDNGQLDDWEWIVGSTHFAQNLREIPGYVIIVDMIGDADQTIFYESNSDSTLSAHLWALADELGYGDYFIPEVRHSILDDHTPFLQRGIPAVDVIDFEYADWHTTRDTLDKVSALSLERVGRVLEVFLEAGGNYPQPEN